MGRLAGKLIAAALAVALVAFGAGAGAAKKKAKKLPRGPYPSLGNCSVFPASTAGPGAPSAADQTAWNRFSDRYKIGRNSPRFWPFVDWMHAWLGSNLPVRAGLLELRAYDKDATPF